MKYRLQDLIDIEQFQALQDRLNAIYSFPSAIIDNDGSILTATAWQDVCTRFHRQNPECERQCIQSDQYILGHLAEANPAVTYRCPHGLVDNAMPIVVDGEHLGNFFTGQFFLEKPDLDFFRAQARRCGFDEDAYMEAVKKVPVWTREQLDSYLSFIKGLIGVVSETGLKNLRAIEARRKSEESERQFQAMFETASIGIAQADPRTGEWLRVNQKMCDITGYTAEEMLALRVPEITHPDDRGRDWKLFQLVVRGEAPSYRLEKRYIRKDGAVVWVNVNMTVIRDDAGQPVRTMAAIEDITERKRAEEEVQLLKKSIDLHHDGAYWRDSEGRFVYVNGADCRSLGYEPGELIGKVLTDVDPGATPERMKAVWEQIKKDGVHKAESVLRRRDGTEFPVEITASYVQFGGKEYSCGFARDITGRKRVEEALWESEGRLKDILFSMADWVWEVDAEGVYTYSSQRGHEFLGYSPEEIIGMTPFDFMPADEAKRVAPLFADIVSRKAPIRNVENWNITRGGERICLLTNGVPILDREGNLKGYRGVDTDITERKRREEEAESSREYITNIVNAIGDPVFVKDEQHRFVLANDAECALLGCPRAELIGKTDADFFPKEQVDVFWKMDDQVIATGRENVNEEPITDTRTGETRTIITSKTRYVDRSGNRFVVGTSSDITERKRIEEALRKSEEMLREAQGIAGLGSYVLDLSAQKWIGSEELDRLLGLDKTYERSMEGWAALFHPDDRAMMTDYFRNEVLGRGRAFDKEYRILRHRDKAERWVHALGRLEFDAQGRPLKMHGTVQDITERKRAEASFHRSRQAFKALADNAPDIVARFDRQLRHLYVSPSVQKATGRPVEDFIGRTNEDLGMPKDLCEAWNTAINAVFVSGRQQKTEFAFPADDGHMAFSTLLVPEFAMDGSVESVLSVSRDITDLKKAGETLRESEQNMRYIVTHDPSAIAVYDRNLRYIAVSKRYLQDYEVAEEDIIGKHHYEVFPEIPQHWREVHRRCLAGAIERNDDDWFERPDGSITYNRWECRPWYQANGEIGGIITYTEVTTERKLAEAEKAKLETQLHQAQKMESVGRLAGGVAHDFNNMLAVILGHVELALNQVDPLQPLHADLEEVHKAARRSADLTRQLLAFARRQTVAPRVLDLNDTVVGTLKMLQRLIGEDIHLELHPSANPQIVKVDPSQIDQILANLCVNARDAIADTGRITIETADRSVDAEYCARNTGAEPGEYVVLTVSDDGCGMDKETLDNIFEPFFTTKGVGEGTGLGLATVYGAVRQNNGFINVYSEPGRGTTFAVYLPRHGGVTGNLQMQGGPPPAPRGNETILLAEDEPSVLKLATKLLQELGYTVLAARTPGAALEIAQECPGEIHLLITDVIMPDMNGRELAARLSQSRPKIRQLFMSGYTANVIAHHGVLDEGVQFIQKPFSAADLAVKVRKALEGQ